MLNVREGINLDPPAKLWLRAKGCAQVVPKPLPCTPSAIRKLTQKPGYFELHLSATFLCTAT